VSRECTECLFLPSSKITQNTNILREDIFTSADNGDGWFREVLVIPVSIGTLTWNGVLFEFSEDIVNFETLLEIVVLVRINELQILATVENDRMVLVVRLAVPENWITGKLDTELGSMTSGFGDKLTVAIDESRENPRVSAFLPGGLLFEVHDLKVGISAQ
jgi:hypothetical protein